MCSEITFYYLPGILRRKTAIYKRAGRRLKLFLRTERVRHPDAGALEVGGVAGNEGHTPHLRRGRHETVHYWNGIWHAHAPPLIGRLGVYGEDNDFELTTADRDHHVHVAASLFHDVAPARELGQKIVWINRLGEKPEPEPDRELPDLSTLPDTLDALVPAPA